jgi:hypothetical protein
MRRYEPGADSHRGLVIPASLVRSHEPGSTDALVNRLLTDVGAATLISWQSTSLDDKFRQLCYWRQVVNSTNN